MLIHLTEQNFQLTERRIVLTAVVHNNLQIGQFQLLEYPVVQDFTAIIGRFIAFCVAVGDSRELLSRPFLKYFGKINLL